VLTAHVRATAAEQTDRGWKVRKLKSSMRIDATVAAVMAHYRAEFAADASILPLVGPPVGLK
jgi:phage terminase large subunit-like protein